MIGQDDVPEVLAVGGGEPVLPVVGGQAVLPAAGRRLQTAGLLGMEADAAAAQATTAGMAGFSAERDRAAVAAGASVDPVIEAPLQAVEQLLDVVQVEAGVEGAATVGLAVAIGVFEVEEVRGDRDEQAAFPRHHRRREAQVRRQTW